MTVAVHASSASASRRPRLLRLALRPALAALVLGLLTLLGLPAPGSMVHPAQALSCIPSDINDDLRQAEFAFIGRPQVELPGPDHGPRQFLFDVEVWVKGNLGTPVTVTGFEWSTPEIGRRMAMIVSLTEEGLLRDNECVGTQPETLLAIAALASEQISDDPPALLIGGEFGDSRVMALDGRGRLVGLGPGEGAVSAMAVCPGGRRTVELVTEFMHGTLTSIAVRDTATLEIVREAALPVAETGFVWPEALACLDEDADVLVGLPGLGIDRLTDRVEPLHAGNFTAFAISSRWAVVAPSHDHPVEGEPFTLSLLDLATGEQTPLAGPTEPTEPTAFAFSPDETHLAYVGRAPYDSPGGGILVHVFDLDGGELVATQRLPAPPFCDSCWGEVAWLDEDTLLVRDRLWDENTDELLSSVRIFSLPDLELVDEWSGGQGTVGRAAAGLLLAIDQSSGVHRLLATPISGGEPVELRVLPTHNAATLLTLPDFDEAAAAALLSQASPSPAPVSPSPTPASPVPPTAGETASFDPVAPVVLLALAALVTLLIGAAFVWRRRAKLG